MCPLILWSRRAVTLLAFAGLIGGCANFVKLEQDLSRFEAAVHEFQIDVSIQDVEVSAIVVLALADARGEHVTGFVLGTRPATFELLLDQQPTWFFAYDDRNRDLRFQSAEPHGWSTVRPIDPEKDPDRLARIVIRAAPPHDPDLPDLLVDKGLGDSLWRSININLDTVTPLDDPLFSRSQADKGLWQPFAFLEDGGAGIHFLEPYDSNRSPVLFVHGINASPQDFTALIENLDTSRYQAWVVSYPSGLPLDTVGTGVYDLLQVLHHKYQFKTLDVVAHSMGGLVSRRSINTCSEQQSCAFLRSYTTISTPWGGIASAGTGVDWAPAVVPVWRDLAPDSAFLRYLFETPLPVPHELVFGFRNSSVFGGTSSDGIIDLSSQLTQPAQDQATGMHGYDEGHVSILSSPLLHARVYAILDAAGNQ